MASREDLPFPERGLVLTHFVTVRDRPGLGSSRPTSSAGRWCGRRTRPWSRVANGWIIINPGGGPTPDKPDVTLTPPEPGDPVSAFLNVRVADIAAFYADAFAKGARLLTAKSAATCVTRTGTESSSTGIVRRNSGQGLPTVN